MAPRSNRRRSQRRAAVLDFAALEVVGGLLNPDMVARIAAFEARDQNEASYSVPPGLTIRDEIARYFRIGEALWARFAAARTSGGLASERFVGELLQQCFGFDAVDRHVGLDVGVRAYPIHHSTLGRRVPIVIAPAPVEESHRSGIDEPLDTFGDGARRRSATVVLQEFLNADESVAWGLATDGVTLRLLRDNLSLTRPAWIEADLAKIFEESLFPDFSALWLLIHASRFGAPGASGADCPLERWREQGRTEGVAARDKLRDGVEAALLELGQGFLEHPDNDALRRVLAEGRLTRSGLFEELLRVVYRLIFLFAAEDRDLLHAPDADEAARRVYAEGYGVGRLRERAMRRSAWDRHGDAWEGLKATFAALGRGAPTLGLTALGGLFARDTLPSLGAARLENRRLLAAVWRLAWIRPEGQPLTRVNWRDMETEELGSVYESLLELTPLVSADVRTFTFAVGEEARGHARKSTGSYYTPDALVKLLLDSALDPVLDAAEARNPQDPAAEILSLNFIDPACGSGHFLLAAARRSAERIAKARSAGVPSRLEYQHALREVMAHCIYGVDRNPMAVELCKVALWIEALEPGKPLTFLDARIRLGDSLIGVFDYDMLTRGVPDEAYKELTGDDKETAKAYRALNREDRDGRAGSGFLREMRPPSELVDSMRALLDMPEDSLEEIAAKEQAFRRLHDVNWQSLKAACDLYVAAFFTPKQGGAPDAVAFARPAMPLTGHVWAAARGDQVYQPLVAAADVLANEVGAFHWPLQFPHVFARGGFDAVVGNPPWERIKLQEQEFFASRDPEIANAPNAAARRRQIAALAEAGPGSAQRALFDTFERAKRDAEAASEFARNSGRYPLTGAGDVNTYALFAELFSRLARTAPKGEPARSIAQVIADSGGRRAATPTGRAGIIVPTGIATDLTTSTFFRYIIDQKLLISLVDFQTGQGFFDEIGHAKFKFCVLTISTRDGGEEHVPEFAFFLRKASDFEQKDRFFHLDAAHIQRINPNTRTAPVFRSRADAELTAKLYQRAPVLIEDRGADQGGDVNTWGIDFQTLFHMSNDSGLFATAAQLQADGWARDGTDWVREARDAPERCVPLYEAKMVHHFNHRWATYPSGAAGDDDARELTATEKANPRFEPEPRYWVQEHEVMVRAARVPAALKRAWRDENPDRCLKALAEWLAGYVAATEGHLLTEDELGRVYGRQRAWRSILGKTPDVWARLDKTQQTAAASQRETPLTGDDVTFLAQGPREPLELAWAIILRKQPRWLMGWRDITGAIVERTVIASVFPKVGIGNKLPLIFRVLDEDARLTAALCANLAALVFDYAARQKIGGTTLNYFIFEQLPVLVPQTYSAKEVDWICSRVLELTYTSHSMKLWAEDLGHAGSPFAWDEARRAQLRAELDAFFAMKYGLSRDELRYVLDPASVRGPDYPSETFRVLKENEFRAFGEYRTERLVLKAWDRLAGSQIGTTPIRVRPAAYPLDALSAGAWARPPQPHPGDTGAALTAILKALDGPTPIRDVRLAGALMLEPRLLAPLVSEEKALVWRRLVGPEAEPLQGNVAAFVPHHSAAWGAAVRNHRGNQRLNEDLNRGTWAPGPGLEEIETAGWPDGRAGFVLDALRNIDLDAAVRSLPGDVQAWIADVAAA